MEELPPVTVTAPATSAKADGSAAAGYRTENADLGPLGDKKILDTPYSIVSVPLDADGSRSRRRRSTTSSNTTLPRRSSRAAISISAARRRAASRIPARRTPASTGFNSYTIMSYPMEAFQSLEILNGAAGALYGASSPAEPSISSASGRPMSRSPPRRSGYDSHALFTEHVEFSGHAGDAGAFGYRINALTCERRRAMSRARASSGNCSPEISTCASPTDKNGTQRLYYLVQRGGLSRRASSMAPTPASLPTRKMLISYLPAPLDPTKEGYGVHRRRADADATNVDFKVIHAFSPDWKLTFGGLVAGYPPHGKSDGNLWRRRSRQLADQRHSTYNVIVGDTGLRQDVHSASSPISTAGWTHSAITHDVCPGNQRLRADRLARASARTTCWDRPAFRRPDRLHDPRLRQSRLVLSNPAIPASGDRHRRHHHLQRALPGRWSPAARPGSPAGALAPPAPQTADYNAVWLQPDDQPDLQADPGDHDLCDLCRRAATGRHRADHRRRDQCRPGAAALPHQGLRDRREWPSCATISKPARRCFA